MKSILFFIFICFSVGIIPQAEPWPMLVWAPNIPYVHQDLYQNTGYHAVPVLLSTGQIGCGEKSGHSISGCFNTDVGIIIEAEYAFSVVGGDGCTTWDHEAWHAWGFHHGEGPLGNLEACNPK